jgi:flagellar basal-body rod protein FlgB
MPISNIPIISMLRSRMQWHQERQRVLAENVANADSPGFRPRDLAPPDLGGSATGSGSGLALARTDAGHISAGIHDGGSYFAPARSHSSATVNLEDEMLKVAANQMDYQAATTLYGRSLGLIKTAVGRG